MESYSKKTSINEYPNCTSEGGSKIIDICFALLVYFLGAFEKTGSNRETNGEREEKGSNRENNRENKRIGSNQEYNTEPRQKERELQLKVINW